MIRESNISNPAAKQRLRDAINRQIDQFLECGGKIRVIETSRKRSAERLLSPWHSEDEFDGLLD